MAKSSEAFTVFYAWQSDMPSAHCRYLIRDALDEAADKLNASDDVNYRVNIDQDTQNEPGLCDIPATLLAKIQNASAVVADLTYVAQTANSPPKLCSNPNILFELGFAFRAIGHERLVCVMNEAHGPRSEQIFDLGHRRHPIPFRSPDKPRSRAKIATKLADALVDALRPIVALGPRNLSGDDAVRHEMDRASITAIATSRSQIPGRIAPITFVFCPIRYSEKRWPNIAALEQVVRNRATRSLQHDFPPQERGTAGMQWGIYNDMYGVPWALTYAGQFWMRHNVMANFQGPTVRDAIRRASPEPLTKPTLDPGEWVNFMSVRAIYDTFDFIVSLSSEFHDQERVELSMTCNGLAGIWLGFTGPSYEDPMGPCIAPDLIRRRETTPGELRIHWKEWCAEWMTDLTDLFSRDGRRMSLKGMRQWVERFSDNRFF